MLNPLRPAMTRVFTPVGKLLARTPVTPNAVTVIGTVGVAGGALGLFPIGELFPGAFTCTIFVFLDMLDGVLARLKGTSGRWGAFLDSTMDRIADQPSRYATPVSRSLSVPGGRPCSPRPGGFHPSGPPWLTPPLSSATLTSLS